MYGNKDWENVKKRYEAWWDGEILDRPLICVTAPKDGRPYGKAPSLDIEYMVDAQKYKLNNTYFGGDAFAWFFPNLGTDIFSGMMGAELEFTEYCPGSPPFEYTSWARPFVKDWSGHSYAFDPENSFYKKAMSFVRLALEKSNGDYMVGFPDLIGGIDCLSAIRGAEDLCVDLLDVPELIQERLAEIRLAFKEAYNKFHNVLHTAQGCAPATLPVWHPGRYFINIKDFSCMISNGLYKEFVLPDVLTELDFLDETIYHLDGPDALRHLDIILETRVKCIQWVAGSGETGGLRSWIPLYQRIQAAGKNIWVYCQPGEIDLVLENLSPEGLLIQTWADNEEDAEGLVKRAASAVTL